MARLDRQASLRLLSVALEAGITHFDTARLYGYGDAEGVLGEFASGRRDQVTIVSKVGILPPPRSSALSFAKGLARQAMRLYPPLRAELRRRAEGMVKSGVFEIPAIRASLHTSLRELRVEYLDVLLLHDCTTADLERPELLEFLERGRQEGKFHRYGIASSPDVCDGARRDRPRFADVLQFPSNARDRAVETIAPMGAAVTAITHSTLGETFLRTCDRLAADERMAREWSEALGIDALDRRALGAAFLIYALNANPSGCVLFSSTSEENIRLNSATAQGAGRNRATGDALVSCLAAAHC